MKLPNSLIIYLVVIVLTGTLGSLSYNQVASKNVPVAPDEITVSITQTIEDPKTVDQVTELRDYQSIDKVLTFQFPDNWFQEDTSPDKDSEEAETVLQTSTITNFPLNKSVSSGFPQDGIRADITIKKLTQKVAQEELLECQMKSIECKTLKVSSQNYQISDTVLNSGFFRKEVATDTKTHRISVIFMVATGSKQEENKEKIEEIIKTFKVN